jgi:hypothetical protein
MSTAANSSPPKRYEVDVAHGLLDDARHGAKGAVAGALAAPLGVGAEVVEIKEQQGELRSSLDAALYLLAQSFVEVAVVVQAGEAVGDRLDLRASGLRGGSLQHRRERLRHLAVRAFSMGHALGGRDVRDETDHAAVGVEQGRLAADAERLGGTDIAVDGARRDDSPRGSTAGRRLWLWKKD